MWFASGSALFFGLLVNLFAVGLALVLIAGNQVKPNAVFFLHSVLVMVGGCLLNIVAQAMNANIPPPRNPIWWVACIFTMAILLFVFNYALARWAFKRSPRDASVIAMSVAVFANPFYLA